MTLICPNCNHENQSGKFCERCGNNLANGASSQVAATSESTRIPASNQYLETTKAISKQYFSYFVQVLKKPYSSSKSVGSEHFVNGIITMCLYALIIPLMFYFALKGILADMSSFGSSLFGEDVDVKPPFGDIVVKPFFAYLIFILLVTTFSFVAVKLGRIQTNFKEVTARFGSFLIPFVLILLIALIMCFLKIKLFLAFLLFGFIGSVFIVPPLVIASFKQKSYEGLDTIYGALLTYILTFIAIGIMGDMLFESIKSGLAEFIPFGDL